MRKPLKPFLRIALRHWGKLAFVVLLLVAGSALYAKPELRQRAEVMARPALEWAGFIEHSHESSQIYWCPMHPQIKRNNPNEVCPICNMALVPLEGGASDTPPDELTLTARQVQQAGVASEAVLRRDLYRQIDTTGRIDYDERRLATITSWVRGRSRIQKLNVNYKGIHVEQGQLMAELYSPELSVAQDEYLRARKMQTEVRGLNLRESLVDAARQKLIDQGMTTEQIEELERTGQARRTIPVFAPASGTVHRMHVREGLYVMEGDKLFELVDLSQMWVFADIFEEEISQVSLDMKVDVIVESLPGETFEGTVSFIDHMVSPDTRTIPIRIVVENPEHKLKAGMFARVEFRHEWADVLAVPENAVMWSGKRTVAIVRQNEGTFQPRELRLGQKWLYTEQTYRPGGQLGFGTDQLRFHEVLGGLSPGEQVITAGTFLLNAESQFQSVLTKMLPPRDQPATLDEAMGQPLADGIRSVLDAYFALTTSLTEDQLEPIAGQAEKLAATSRKLARLAAEADAGELKRSAMGLAEHAEQLGGAGPSDLHEARIGYGRISRDLFTLVAENGGPTLLGKSVFAFHCGMAKVGYENWLWWSPQIHNPYMGQKMLTCGTKLESLTPE